MDSSRIKFFIVLVLALLAALQLGVAAATAQFEAIAWIVGGTSLVICIALGRRIWLILPFMTTLGLVLPLPGHFSSELIGQAVVCGFCALLFLMRRLPIKPAITELEVWCLILIAFVAQAYFRNPVGLNIFGGDTVGARPYVIFAATAVTAGLLSMLAVQPNDLKWWVRLSLAGAIVNFGIGTLVKLVPQLGMFFGATFATDISRDGFTNVDTEGRAGRVSFVRQISATLSVWIASRVSPLRGCFHPVWAPLILFTLAAAAFSGYRSHLALVGLTYFIGICYRGGFKGVAISTVLGGLALALVAVVNLTAPLPPNIQRALTFLPGTWDERYKQDTEGSTAWRMEMWQEALTSDRYIKNKLIGDGLGLSADELARINVLNQQNALGVSGFDVRREAVMLTGDYHSGPVETIRVIGYAGLLFLLLGMIRVAVHAHRQIVRSRNTEWYPTALFIGIPLIVQPIFWVLIYGSFAIGASSLLLGSALVRLMENNLPLPAWNRSRWQPYLSRVPQGQVAPSPAVPTENRT